MDENKLTSSHVQPARLISPVLFPVFVTKGTSVL